MLHYVPIVNLCCLFSCKKCGFHRSLLAQQTEKKRTYTSKHTWLMYFQWCHENICLRTGACIWTRGSKNLHKQHLCVQKQHEWMDSTHPSIHRGGIFSTPHTYELVPRRSKAYCVPFPRGIRDSTRIQCLFSHKEQQWIFCQACNRDLGFPNSLVNSCALVEFRLPDDQSSHTPNETKACENSKSEASKPCGRF